MRTRSLALVRSALVLALASALAGCPSIPEPRGDAGGGYDPVTGNRFDGPLSLSDARVQAVDRGGIPAGMACLADGDRPLAVVVGVVERIVDGDTLYVTVPEVGESFDVRMIGVNAPETSHAEDGGVTMAECYGDEAMALTELLRGRSVLLSFDQGCRDPFDRLLAYVWIGSGPGDLWQRQLLRRGLARTLSIEPNTAMAATFAEDEDAARAASIGLWGACP